MKLGKVLRDWSSFHKPDTDSSIPEPRFFSFMCSACGKPISISLAERISDWDMFPRHPFTQFEQEQIKNFYAMGPWSHSPCGGGIHFDKVSCPSCLQDYLFSYGVYEPNNGLNVLTVEGIVAIVDDNA